MRFALIDNQRVEAEPKLKGYCPVCNERVIAKCGKQRIHHWAHLGDTNCDKWYEPETEWHRAWKNKFPTEQQECILYDDKSGEKHIADVRTAHGLVIEFQHSFLNPDERAARETFYKNMVWVVDGTRLKRDYSRFQEHQGYFRSLNKAGFFSVDSIGKCFPVNWVQSSVPVIFDFSGVTVTDHPDILRNALWCLLPGRVGRESIVVCISRKDFINTTLSRPELLPVKAIMDALAKNHAANIMAQRNYQLPVQWMKIPRRKNWRL